MGGKSLFSFMQTTTNALFLWGSTCTNMFSIVLCAGSSQKHRSFSADSCCPLGIKRSNSAGFMLYCFICSIYHLSNLPQAIKSNITTSLCGQKTRAMDCNSSQPKCLPSTWIFPAAVKNMLIESTLFIKPFEMQQAFGRALGKTPKVNTQMGCDELMLGNFL